MTPESESNSLNRDRATVGRTSYRAQVLGVANATQMMASSVSPAHRVRQCDEHTHLDRSGDTPRMAFLREEQALWDPRIAKVLALVPTLRALEE